MYQINSADFNLPTDKPLTILIVSSAVYGGVLADSLKTALPVATVKLSTEPVPGSYDVVFSVGAVDEQAMIRLGAPLYFPLQERSFFVDRPEARELMQSDYRMVKLLEGKLVQLAEQGLIELSDDERALIEHRSTVRNQMTSTE